MVTKIAIGMGVTAATRAGSVFGTATAGLANTLLTYPSASAEPPLRPYVLAD